MKADAAAIAAAARCLARRRAGRVSDRDRLRARRRCRQWRGRRAALRGQRPAALQSADRACRRPATPHAALARFRRRRRAARRRVLARAADAGAAEAPRLPASPISRSPASTAIAVRVPAHPVARALLEAFGGPVVAPSANRSGHVSPTSAAHVLADLRGRIDLVDRRRRLRGRRRVDDRRLSRRADRCCGRAACRARRSSACSAVRSPTPRRTPTKRRSRPACWPRTTRRKARLRLECATRRAPARRCSRSARAPRRRPMLNLSPRGDLDRGRGQSVFAFARARCLRRREHRGDDRSRDEGLGEAINDRLARAAAPRPGDAAMNLQTKPSRTHARRPTCSRASPRSSARNTPSPTRTMQTAVSASRCATSTTATRRWCCGRARSRRSPRSSSSPTRPRPRSCRRAAIPAWSAGRSRINGEIVLSLNAARQDPRGRCRLQHHDGRSRRHAAARARGRGRMPTGSIRNCCRRKAPAPSAAISRPMPAAPRRSRTASRARTRSGSRSCSPTAAC